MQPGESKPTPLGQKSTEVFFGWIIGTVAVVVLALVLVWFLPMNLYRTQDTVTFHPGSGFSDVPIFPPGPSISLGKNVKVKVGKSYGVLRPFKQFEYKDITLNRDEHNVLGLPWRLAASIALSFVTILIVALLSKILYRVTIIRPREQALMREYLANRNELNQPV